jgi:NDP-4-keto-2,6-dideoxyhexose 3-C-methyltransferase
MYRRISSCRICGNTNLIKVIDLGRQVLTGRFPAPGEPDPTAGPLELLACHGADPARHCGLLQLSCSYQLDEMYGATYGYRSALNQSMVRHLSELVEAAVAWAQPQVGDRVLDIGANDGTLLKFYEGLGLKRYGIDPSSARYAADYPADVGLIVDFFSAERVRRLAGDGGFKLITSIAMFYDLDDPMAFVREVRDLLHPEGIWVFEQGYASRMLDNVAYDSICHEHISYFDLRQIRWLIERAGLKLLDVSTNDTNGGSFCVTAARAESSHRPRQRRLDAMAASEAGQAPLARYDRFRAAIDDSRARLLRFLGEARASGKTVMGYGASTKGNVVIQHCGLGARDLAAIAEKHPGKYGRVTPGSRIPIISESAARAARPDYFLVLPWHFRAEIVRRETQYLADGGTLVFPLPRLELVSSASLTPGSGPVELAA